MSLEKSELKKLVLQDIGVQLDDMLEIAQKTRAQCEGGKTALREAARNLTALMARAEEEADEEKIPDLPTLGHVKRYLAMAVTCVENAGRHWENKEISAGGSVNFGALVVKVVKKLHTEAARKVEVTQQALADPDGVTVRPEGVRPGPSIAQQRRAGAVKPVKKGRKRKVAKKAS